MATHIGMYGANLRIVGEVWTDGPARVSLTDGNATVDLVGGILELRELLGSALDELKRLDIERSKRMHPSMFQCDGTPEDGCEGSSMPDGTLPPGVQYLTPSQANAANTLNAMMRQREEQDRILDAIDAEEFGGDAA